MLRLILFDILFGVLMIMGSCTHKDEIYDPVVNFIEPQVYHIVNMPDTLDVKVDISDKGIIRYIILSLVNADHIPVIPSKYYYPNSTTFTIEAALALVDKSLQSGTYQIMVTVSDEVNMKNSFLGIGINEVPASVLAYIAVATQLPFESTIIKLKPDFETDTQFVLQKNFWLSGVQGLWGKFFFISAEPSKIVAYNAENFDKEWEMAAHPPRPLITAIYMDKNLVFSTDNGDAGILISDGTLTLLTSPYENKTIRCLAADEKYVYAAHVSLSGQINELTVYYRVSGSILAQVAMSGEIAGLVPERGVVLVILPSALGTGFLEYDPEEMMPAQIGFLEGEEVQSAVKISDQELFLLTTDKVISYDLNHNLFTDFIDEHYKFCRYDRLNDIVFLGRDNVVNGFDRVTGELVKDISFTGEVLDFQILCNK